MNIRANIAVVDDEPSVRESLRHALETEGFRVWTFSEGLAAWDTFQDKLPDLVVLDILMPRMDGIELCRKLRTLSEALPVIFLTSKDEEFDKVLGLEIGGDDYLCKPFSVRELMARIKVLLRRQALLANAGGRNHVSRRLDRGAISLDLEGYTVTMAGKPVPLTVTEFRILKSLMEDIGIVKTREALIAEAYPEDTYLSDRTVDCHIKRLRRKLVEADPGFDGIETVYGLGYKYCS